MDKNIVIYWMTGTGKSTLWKAFASQEDFKLVDTDSEIENILNESIKEYIDGHEIKEEWEKNFRELETQTIENSLKKPGKKIISLWWWAIISPQNRKIIYKLADKIIHVQSDIQDIVKRIMQDEKNWIHRPSFKYPGKAITPEEIIERWEDRKETYQNSCDFTIENNWDILKAITQIKQRIHTGDICLPITNFDPQILTSTFEKINLEPSIKFTELRIDSLHNIKNINGIIKQCQKKVVVTNRHAIEWWNFKWGFEESVEKLSQIEWANYIDIEIQAGKNIKKLKQHTQNKNIWLIASHHNFQKTESLGTLKNTLKEMEKYDPEVYKIAMMPKTEEDVNIMYRLT